MKNLEVTYRGTVYPWHCDHMGHMNVMWYVGKFDEATWQFLASIGLGRAALTKSGAGVAAVEQQISYKRELRAGDIISVTSSVLDAKDRSFRFRHDMHNDGTGELAASTVLTGVYFDTTSRKACALPKEVRERIAMLTRHTTPEEQK